MLSAVLSRLGLVRRSRFKKANEDLKRTQARLDKVLAHGESLRAEMRAARQRAEDMAAALKEEQQRLKGDLDRKRQDLNDKFENDERRRAEADQKRRSDFEAMQQRLKTTERELAIARESLMAVEVKLDILEGAANVLDARTRDVLAEQNAETTTPI
jgi:chromosome segregation ATPase